MKEPLVSVILCNYNHARYLRQCLAGLLGQTHKNIQIAITDDGSTDGSQDLIREYAAKDPRVEPNFFPKNRGVADALCDCVSRARGKYLYGVSADDFVINMDFFKRGVQILEADARPAGYYGITGIYVAEKEQLTGGMGSAEVEGYNTPLQLCEGFLKFRVAVTSLSCLWRRDMYMAGGGNEMPELMRTLQSVVDNYLSHNLAWRHGMYYEKTPIACQRVFEAKSNFSSRQTIWNLAAWFAEMERRLRQVGLNYPEMEKDWERWRALMLMDSLKKSGVV